MLGLIGGLLQLGLYLGGALSILMLGLWLFSRVFMVIGFVTCNDKRLTLREYNNEWDNEA